MHAYVYWYTDYRPILCVCMDCWCMCVSNQLMWRLGIWLIPTDSVYIRTIRRPTSNIVRPPQFLQSSVATNSTAQRLPIIKDSVFIGYYRVHDEKDGSKIHTCCVPSEFKVGIASVWIAPCISNLYSLHFASKQKWRDIADSPSPNIPLCGDEQEPLQGATELLRNDAIYVAQGIKMSHISEILEYVYYT